MCISLSILSSICLSRHDWSSYCFYDYSYILPSSVYVYVIKTWLSTFFVKFWSMEFVSSRTATLLAFWDTILSNSERIMFYFSMLKFYSINLFSNFAISGITFEYRTFKSSYRENRSKCFHIFLASS